MFSRLFVDHPRSVDESYAEHFGVASRFGLGGVVSSLLPLVVGSVGKLLDK